MPKPINEMAKDQLYQEKDDERNNSQADSQVKKPFPIVKHKGSDEKD